MKGSRATISDQCSQVGCLPHLSPREQQLTSTEVFVPSRYCVPALTAFISLGLIVFGGGWCWMHPMVQMRKLECPMVPFLLSLYPLISVLHGTLTFTLPVIVNEWEVCPIPGQVMPGRAWRRILPLWKAEGTRPKLSFNPAYSEGRLLLQRSVAKSGTPTRPAHGFPRQELHSFLLHTTFVADKRAFSKIILLM